MARRTSVILVVIAAILLVLTVLLVLNLLFPVTYSFIGITDYYMR
ncbi:MAG: hypothetical protein ABI670_01290 [Chloroflexota bacterium]